MLFGVFIFLNLFQVWQLTHGLLHPSRTTKASYLANFLQIEASPNYTELLLLDQSVPAKERVVNHTVVKTIIQDFESIDLSYQNRLSNDAYEGNFSSIVDSSMIYSLTLEEKYKNFMDFNPDNYVLKISAFVKPINGSPNELKLSLVSKFLHNREGYADYSADSENINPKLKINKWNEVIFYRYFPTIRHPEDEIQVFLYNRGKTTALIDLIKVEVVAVDNR